MVKLDRSEWIKVEDMSNYTLTGLANGKHTAPVQVFDSSGHSKDATSSSR